MVAVERLGMRFQRLDFQGPDSLTDAVFDQTRQTLRDAETRNQAVMLHCGSANRVGAIWLVHRVLDDGLSLEEAEREAREVGLRTEGYLVRAKQYIQARN